MLFDFHTTRHAERMKLLEGDRPFTWKEISPNNITNLAPSDRRSVVWEENTGDVFAMSYHAIWATLEQYRSHPGTIVEQYEYYKVWHDRKGYAYCAQRIANLILLYESMKQKGFRKEAKPFSVAITTNGEKLDGSHRAVVAQFLGIEKIEVKEYSFKWDDLDTDYVERRVRANQLQKPNYYHFDYGTPSPGRVYSENSYERWDVLKGLIPGDKIIDLGCNEGFMSLQLALQGKEVFGIDHEFIEGANTNKLLFEIQNKKGLPVQFNEGKIQDFEGSYDTALLLNVIYHLPKQDVVPLMKKLRESVRTVIMQGNLRKIHEHERFWGITAGDMEMMLENAGFKTKRIEWRDKPIVIGV